MSKNLTALQSWLKKYRYILAAFLIPLAARSVPEIVSAPYTIGVDTLNYVQFIQDGWVFSLGTLGIAKTTSLFYLIATPLNGLFNDAFLIVKIMGPLLLSALSLMMYLYARRGLGWSNVKSLLVSILISTYFISLRLSWDFYKQMLGFIFLVAVFVALKSFSSPRKYYAASVLMVLTVWSHELAAVTLFFVVGLEAIRYLVKNKKKETAYLLSATGLSAALFFFQLYSPQKNTISFPVLNYGSGPSLYIATEVAVVLVYCYVLILPLVLLGLTRSKDLILRYWAILCLVIPLLTILFPGVSLPYWDRWVYILIYPSIFFAVEGLSRLWKLGSSLKRTVKRVAPMVLAIGYLSMLVVLGGFYLASTPDHAFSWYSQYNPYLIQIPSSMLQNTVASEDTPALVACLKWLNQTVDLNSTVVTNYATNGWAEIYLRGSNIATTINADPGAAYTESIVNSAKKSFAEGQIRVYTVWWTPSEGWSQIPSLPSDFTVVHAEGEMAVYMYNPET